MKVDKFWVACSMKCDDKFKITLPLLLVCSQIHRDFLWQSNSDQHVNHEMNQEGPALVQPLQRQPA